MNRGNWAQASRLSAGETHVTRIPVKEAALRLRKSANAVRMLHKRKLLAGEKDRTGHLWFEVAEIDRFIRGEL